MSVVLHTTSTGTRKATTLAARKGVRAARRAGLASMTARRRVARICSAVVTEASEAIPAECTSGPARSRGNAAARGCGTLDPMAAMEDRTAFAERIRLQLESRYRGHTVSVHAPRFALRAVA